jgi:NAD(P)-dependent dehydrogenase (short-subunit alcohol dehydrogenase family)
LEELALRLGGDSFAVPLDIADPDAPARLRSAVTDRWGGLDILVHGAGAFRAGRASDIPLADLDLLYQVNVRAPFAVTQAMLPLLREARGQIAFVNSTVVRAAELSGRGAYAASKAALKALTDSLRDEVNGEDIRVISVYPGTTATPLQESLHAASGKLYRPERLLQPEDVAQCVCDALAMPRTAEVTDIFVRPMAKG